MSWFTDTLIATGALIALVLVLRRPVARWFGPGMAYALWALPLLRLVLPPLVLPAAPEPMMITVTPATVDFAGPLPAPEPAVWPYTEIVVALWLAGALGFLAWRVISYHTMRRAVLAEARPVGEVGAIRMVESPAIPAPVAFGLRDKVIALPPGFMASEDRTARDLAIAHELEHHAGRDIAVNFAMQPLLALHWFNPIAWAGWRALRRDQEAACDARVLAGRCGETRAAYARLIADFAQGQRFSLAAPLACPVVGEKSIIHRLRSLTMTEPTPVRRHLGRLMIGVAALALPLTASITYAASDPATPAPPAAPDAPKVQVEKHVVVIKEEQVEDGDHSGHGDGKGKVVIVEHQGGPDGGEEGMSTRTITRDGRTYVFKTDKPMSDAEVEAKIAGIEKGHALGARAIAIVHPEGGEHREVRTFVLSGKDAEWTSHGEHGAQAMACSDGKVSEANATVDRDGKKEVVKLKICSKGGDMTKAIAGLRQARDKVAADSNLSGETKAEVLKELDAEIARLSKEG